MKELAALWEPIYSSRIAWRKRAIQTYIDTIKDEDIKDIVENSLTGSVPVALYGKSQVGKTTFLLSLMGIKDEYIHIISDILRCGSRKGAAATPTAMIYRQSKDVYFRVIYHSHAKELQTENEVRDELIELRQSIERKKFQQLEEVIVEIPSRYFKDDDLCDIQICDLPGIHSSNEDEKPHVEKIIKKFFPISSLKLVFQIGNDINDASRLFNNNSLTEIYGWKYSPKQFRLIITHAYSASSIPALKMFDDPINGKSLILQYYRTQANQDELNPDNVPESVKIFPLEMGDSLCNLGILYNEEEVRNIKLIMNEFWAEIRKDIVESAYHGNIVQRIIDYKPIIQQLLLENRRKLENCLNDYENLTSIYLERSFTINERNTESTKEISIREEKILELEKIKLLSYTTPYRGGRNRDAMKLFIQLVYSSLNTELKALERYPEIKAILIDGLKEIGSLTKPINDKLETTLWNTPILWMGGPSDDDVLEMGRLCIDINKLIAQLNAKIDHFKNAMSALYKDEMTSYSKKIDFNHQIIIDSDVSFGNDEQILEKEIKSLQNKISNLEQELEQKNDIIDLMHLSLKEEVQKISSSNINLPPLLQFLNLMKIALYDRELKKHLTLGDNRDE